MDKRTNENSGFRIALVDCPVPEAQRSSGPCPRIVTIHLTFMFRNHDRGVLLPSASAETCASLRRRMLTLSPRRRTLANLTTRFHRRCDRHRGTRRARRYRHPQAVFFPAAGGDPDRRDGRDHRPTGKFPSAP